MRKLRSRLNYANVMSTLAVFLVLGGTAMAAAKLGKNTVGTKQLKENAVTTVKIKDGAVTGSKLNLATLGTVPAATTATNAANAAHADTATNATNAVNATTAGTAKTATDSQSLGGVPASGYTRSECDSQTGAVKGFAQVDAAAVSQTELSTAGVEFPYNCSGGQVLAKQLQTGKYEVKFVDSPVQIAAATAMTAVSPPNIFPANSASVNRIGPGDFVVQIWNNPTGQTIDGSFNVLTP